MRKDGKQQYLIKKEKLLQIKKIILDENGEYLTNGDGGWIEIQWGKKIDDIWRIVKNEK